MNKKRSFATITLALLLALSINVSGASEILSTEEKAQLTRNDKKVHCTATLDDSFADDTVTVVINNSNSKIGKVFEKKSFSGASAIEVKDITHIDGSVNEKKYLDKKDFQQILQIKLQNKGKHEVLKAIKQLEKLDFVESAEPNYYYEPTVTPNDPSYSSQYALPKISAPAAWDITKGSTDIKVGIIDSGISDHSDLNPNLAAGWDFYNNNSVTTDDPSGHGTHVAGTIGARGNNSTGVSGVNWNVTLVPLQVVFYHSEDQKYLFDGNAINQAIGYAINNDIPVINCSFGSLKSSNSYETAMSNYSGLISCAAGNDGVDTDVTPHYPSSSDLDNVVSVAATDSSDGLAEFSNVGYYTVDLAAPGVGIYSTVPGNTYANNSGTSMAAPHVAGVGALILSVNPYLTGTQVKSLILDNVDPVGGPASITLTGGRLNAYKAVKAARDLASIVPQTFTGTVNSDSQADVIISRGVSNKRVLTTITGKNDGSVNTPINTMTNNRYNDSDPSYTGDVNGDGRTDMIVHYVDGGKRSFLVYLANSNGTYQSGVYTTTTNTHDPSAYPGKMFVGDVNGDGRDDFIVMYRRSYSQQTRSILVYLGQTNGTFSAAATTHSTNSYVDSDPVYLGDVNGDGHTDMIVHYVDGGKRSFLAYLANSNGTYQTGVYTTTTNTHDPSAYPGKMFVGDVNGDNRDDFIVMYRRTYSEQTRSILVYLGQTNGTFSAAATTHSTNSYVDSDPVYLGDVNGDGRTDMIVHYVDGGKRNFLVYLANSNGTYQTGVYTATTNTHDPSAYPGQMYIDDINGDGKDDFVVIYRDTYSNQKTSIIVYRGSGSGTFATGVRTETSVPYYIYLT